MPVNRNKIQKNNIVHPIVSGYIDQSSLNGSSKDFKTIPFITCVPNIPNNKPANTATIPIQKFSIKNIKLTFLLSIPIIISRPNSFSLLRII